MGRLAAQTGAYEASIEEGLSQTRATDHLVRVFNAGFLAHAPSEQSRQIMTSILKLDPKDFGAVDTVRSLFAIVGGLRDTEPAQVFEFLGRWEWPTSGAGTPLAEIFKHLAATDPVGTKDWLLNQLRQRKDRARTIKLIRGLTVLIQERPELFERNQLERIYKNAFADKAGRQVFAAATGGIATVDAGLAKRILIKCMLRKVRLVRSPQLTRFSVWSLTQLTPSCFLHTDFYITILRTEKGIGVFLI